jgi:hypothetical protein
MANSNARISELTYLFRIVQMIHEVDSVDKVYRMLVSICTCGHVIGCRRAILFTVDAEGRAIRGEVGIEHDAAADADAGERASLENMAREVFEGFEKVEGSALTLRARSVSVPLDQHRSALVKAARTGFPILAEGRLSEFAADPFFSSFGSDSYIAIPIKEEEQCSPADGRESREPVIAVLAAEGPRRGERVDVGRISLLYSLAQQASLAITALKQRAESDRRFRVLSKLTEAIANAGSRDELNDAIRQGMAMLCRALGGTGSLFKDFTTARTLFVKTVHEYSLNAGGLDEATAQCLEEVLERAAGLAQSLHGDDTHALLRSVSHLSGFVACPLVARSDVVGALAVYVEKGHGEQDGKRFSARDADFFAMGAGILGAAIGSRHVSDRLRRNEDFLEEIRSNLAREREKSRLGDLGIEYSERMRDELDRIKQLLSRGDRSEDAISQLATLVVDAEKRTRRYLDSTAPAKSRLANVDLFRMVKAIAESWRKEFDQRGIEATISIPSNGPRLLMEKKKIAAAFENILRSTGSALSTGDKLLVEGHVDEERIKIVFADTGAGLPGDVLSRLFMPFREIELADERKNALSLAGEIISLHGGEIEMKTSLGWKTILVVGFKAAANRDRRRSSKDRRRRSKDRRTPAEKE